MEEYVRPVFVQSYKVRLGLDEIDWTKTGWTKMNWTISRSTGRTDNRYTNHQYADPPRNGQIYMKDAHCDETN